jgi:hypothetical protein
VGKQKTKDSANHYGRQWRNCVIKYIADMCNVERVLTVQGVCVYMSTLCADSSRGVCLHEHIVC